MKEIWTVYPFSEYTVHIHYRHSTYNADLKRRLTRYAERHPVLCRQTDDNGLGGLRFEIQKGRFCFRLTEPYSDERRQAASRYAKEHRSASKINRQRYQLSY